MGRISSWFFTQAPAEIIPIIDYPLALVIRALYLGFYFSKRTSLRLFLGKKKRDRLFANKIYLKYGFALTPAFLVTGLVETVTKFVGINNSILIKITVPRYLYKAFCPANKNDLINFTFREEEIIERFLPQLGDIVIDVGAHLGHYTLIAAKRVGPDGMVIAVEAHVRNFQILNRNVRLNKFSNVKSLNLAAYSIIGNLDLLEDKHTGSYSLYHTLIDGRIKPDEVLQVQAETLDHIIELEQVNPENVKWIKVDVEGAELEVIKGAASILSKSNNISLIVEIHRFSDGERIYQDIVNLLERYQIHIQFERLYPSGERHIIARKTSKTSNT